MSEIVMNDMLEELNKRLIKELAFERQLNAMLNKFRQYLLNVQINCVCNQNKHTFDLTDELDNEFRQLLSQDISEDNVLTNTQELTQNDIQLETLSEDTSDKQVKQQSLAIQLDAIPAPKKAKTKLKKITLKVSDNTLGSVKSVKVESNISLVDNKLDNNYKQTFSQYISEDNVLTNTQELTQNDRQLETTSEDISVKRLEERSLPTQLDAISTLKKAKRKSKITPLKIPEDTLVPVKSVKVESNISLANNQLDNDYRQLLSQYISEENVLTNSEELTQNDIQLETMSEDISDIRVEQQSLPTQSDAIPASKKLKRKSNIIYLQISEDTLVSVNSLKADPNISLVDNELDDDYNQLVSQDIIEDNVLTTTEELTQNNIQLETTSEDISDKRVEEQSFPTQLWSDTIAHHLNPMPTPKKKAKTKSKIMPPKISEAALALVHNLKVVSKIPPISETNAVDKQVVVMKKTCDLIIRTAKPSEDTVGQHRKANRSRPPLPPKCLSPPRVPQSRLPLPPPPSMATKSSTPINSAFKCHFTNCGQLFDKLYDYHKHVDDIHIKFKCNICGKKFAIAYQLKRHKQNHVYDQIAKQPITPTFHD